MRYQLRVTAVHFHCYEYLKAGETMTFHERAVHHEWMRSETESFEDWKNTLERDGEHYIIPIDLSDFGIEAVAE